MRIIVKACNIDYEMLCAVGYLYLTCLEVWLDKYVSDENIKRSDGISPEIVSLISNPPSQFDKTEQDEFEIDDDDVDELAEDEIFVEKKLKRIAKKGNDNFHKVFRVWFWISKWHSRFSLFDPI